MESHSHTLAASLSAKGHRVIMGCSEEGAVEVAGKIILPSRRITITNSGDVAAIVRIARISLREHIEVIIANHGREYWPAAVGARMAGARVIFIRHQIDRLKRSTCWLVNRFVDRVVAVSGAVKDVLVESGISGDKIDIVYNSVSLERFNPSAIDREGARRELGISGDGTVVGTAGKINQGKGVFELFRSVYQLVKKYPSIRLVFVGDGPERDSLEREARKLSMNGKVIFAGSRTDIERMFAAMDIFVLPSYDEGLPTVLIEAMAMERPVIATTVGGIPEIVEDGFNGILIPPRDDEAISEAIVRYIENREVSRRLALEGRRTVELKFSDGVSGNRFADILEALPVSRSKC